MKYLITGGCGFVGSNLAEEVLKRGEDLIIFDNLFRYGSSKNLNLLRSIGDFKYYPFDIRNFNDVETVIKSEKPDIVFHLAGQFAMTTSISNPRLDFEINTLGTFNLLDSIRKYSSHSVVVYSSSNKVYGDFNNLTFIEKETRFECLEFSNGFNESLPLDFHSPYGCSKGAADQYLLDFSRIFGIKTVVFRHSSMYGGNQHSTVDQGWIGWFIKQAIDIKNGTLKGPVQISGNGKQVRDVLFSEDLVNCYFAAIENIDSTKGHAFNIGGGIDCSLSLIELFNILENKLNIKIEYEKLPFRESDQLVFIADITKARDVFGFCPKTSVDTGINKMIEWVKSI